MNVTGWSKNLEVTADGQGIVSHAGLALLRALTDKTGLTRGLSRALATPRLLVHDRGRVMADLACAIADGAQVISDFRVMGANKIRAMAPAGYTSTWLGRSCLRGEKTSSDGRSETVRPPCHHRSRKAQHPRSPHQASDHQHEVQCEARSLLTPVSTAATISSSHRETVRARVSSSGMSSFRAHQS